MTSEYDEAIEELESMVNESHHEQAQQNHVDVVEAIREGNVAQLNYGPRRTIYLYLDDDGTVYWGLKTSTWNSHRTSSWRDSPVKGFIALTEDGVESVPLSETPLERGGSPYAKHDSVDM